MIERETEGRYKADELSNSEYHAQDWAVSSTFLKDMLTHSTAYAQYRAMHKESTPALEFGTAFHTLVLEGEEAFHKATCVAEHGARTKAGKEERAQAAAAGLLCFEQADVDRLLAMRDAVQAHTYAADALATMPRRETSYLWQDQETGVWCRIRPDAHGVFEAADLKTTSNIYGFDYDAMKYGYLLQAAFYRRGLAEFYDMAPDFMFIAVSKAEPYEVGVFSYDAETLQLADDALTGLLYEYAETAARNVYKTGLEVEQVMTPSVWQLKRYQEFAERVVEKNQKG